MYIYEFTLSIFFFDAVVKLSSIIEAFPKHPVVIFTPPNIMSFFIGNATTLYKTFPLVCCFERCRYIRLLSSVTFTTYSTGRAMC